MSLTAKFLRRRADQLAADLAHFAARTADPDLFSACLAELGHLQRLLDGNNLTSSDGPWAHAELAALGRMIQRRREDAQLTRVSLGKLSGLSDSTIKNVEQGRGEPTRRTLLHLWNVTELHLTEGEWPSQAGSPPAKDSVDSGAPPAVVLVRKALARAAAGLAVGRTFESRRIVDSATLEFLRSSIDSYSKSPVPLTVTMEGMGDWVAAVYALASALSVPPSAPKFITLICDGLRLIDAELSFDIAQIPQWSYMTPENALAFSRKAKSIRRWPVAAVYGYVSSGGRSRDAITAAAYLAEQSHLAGALAALLCYFGSSFPGFPPGALSAVVPEDDEAAAAVEPVANPPEDLQLRSAEIAA